MNRSLTHYGVKGMHWGERRRRAKEEKATADFHRRNKVINRIKKNGEEAEIQLGNAYVLRGEKAANRILDLMDKDPNRSFRSASNQQRGEQLAKTALVVIGAKLVGHGLHVFVKNNR